MSSHVRALIAAATTALVMLWAGTACGGDVESQESWILGNWLTEGKDGVIEILRRADGHIDGRIVGGSDLDQPDIRNPDPAKRRQPLRGAVIITGLHYDGDGKWSGGTVYDPDSGRVYGCRAEMRGHDTLMLRGFLGFSLLGRSQLWTRYTNLLESP